MASETTELLEQLVYSAKRTTEILESLARENREAIARLAENAIESRAAVSTSIHDARETTFAQITALAQQMEDSVRGALSERHALRTVKLILDDTRRSLFAYEQTHGATEPLTALRRSVDFARASVNRELGIEMPVDAADVLDDQHAEDRRTEGKRDTTIKFKRDGSVELSGKLDLKLGTAWKVAKLAFHSSVVTTGAAWLAHRLYLLVRGG